MIVLLVLLYDRNILHLVVHRCHVTLNNVVVILRWVTCSFRVLAELLFITNYMPMQYLVLNESLRTPGKDVLCSMKQLWFRKVTDLCSDLTSGPDWLPAKHHSKFRVKCLVAYK